MDNVLLEDTLTGVDFFFSIGYSRWYSLLVISGMQYS